MDKKIIAIVQLKFCLSGGLDYILVFVWIVLVFSWALSVA